MFSFILGSVLTGCSKPASTPAPAQKQQVIWASTIGPIDAGIVAALEDAYEKKTGVRVRHVGAGTGEALKIGQTGSVDLVLTHAKALEEKFVADGYGTQRYDFMFNDFVIMGPAEDPAGIKGEKSALAAMKKIADKKVQFISRGDNSGTNVKEKELWEAAGIKPQGDWYRIYEKGAQGNVPTLLYTDEQKAYTVMDRATYITTKDKIKLAVLVEKDELLLNYITLIPVNPQKLKGINSEGANAFVQWLVSEEAQRLVKEFGKDKYGEPLFFPNSPAGKKV
ncbi:MAG: solute-binding protein [Firmicutes bacterium]|nr:solute-binding protein [Bacillota bacterium]